MTTLSVNRAGQDLRGRLPAEPVSASLRAMLVVLFLVIFGAVLVEIPASAMPSMPSVSVADLGMAPELLSAAANSDDDEQMRELVQCHRHAYRHHLDPATCEITEP